AVALDGLTEGGECVVYTPTADLRYAQLDQRARVGWILLERPSVVRLGGACVATGEGRVAQASQGGNRIAPRLQQALVRGLRVGEPPRRDEHLRSGEQRLGLHRTHRIRAVQRFQGFATATGESQTLGQQHNVIRPVRIGRLELLQLTYGSCRVARAGQR